MPQPRGRSSARPATGQRRSRIGSLSPVFFTDSADVVSAQRIGWDALVPFTRLKKHPSALHTVRLRGQAAFAVGLVRRRMPAKFDAKPSVNMY